MESLWPADIEVVQEKAPVTILREQATLLGPKTKNIVTAEAVATESGQVGRFRYVFYILGPALANYRYKLFEISYGIELYPVTIVLALALARETHSTPKLSPDLGMRGMARLYANSAEELLVLLREIFGAERTRRVIGAILSQSGVELAGKP